MLTRGLLTGLCLALAAVVGIPGVARAGGPVDCGPDSAWNPSLGTCVIVVTGPTGPGGGGSGGGGGGMSAPIPCRWLTGEVDCEGEYGYWSNTRGCYITPSPATYPPSSPIWQGKYPDGAVYTCYNPWLGSGSTYDFWSPTPPAGPAAPPDPRVLAQQALASMQLRAITMGLVPEAGGGAVGLVGMPNWMWVQNPSQNSWGPITRSATAAGYTVTATAKVQRVVWDMGDGQVVTCGAGTPYRDSYGNSSSPTCGHTYTRQGTHTVRATSHWVVAWSGIGQSGTIPLDLVRTARVTIGEAQVLKQ